MSLILNDVNVEYFQALRLILKREPYLADIVCSHIVYLTGYDNIIKDIIVKCFKDNKQEAIIFILKYGLFETFYSPEEQLKFFNKSHECILDIVETELKDVDKLKEYGMVNVEDKGYFLSKLKKNIFKDKKKDYIK